MEIKFSTGNGIAIKLDGQNVLLDPKVSDFISFTTHAHFDHLPQVIVNKPYCTEETAELAKSRISDFEANVVKENKKIKFDDFTAEMIPAGHVLGSTQVFIEADGKSILYTGDFKLWKNLTCRPVEIREADVLVMETTYGNPSWIMPEDRKVRKDVVDWTKKTSENFTTHLGGYSLGKSQEAIKLLNENGIVPQVSDSIRKFSEVYNKYGAKLKFLEKDETSDVNIKPMHLIPEKDDARNKHAVLTGWSLFRNYGVQGFPFTDHADYNQLLVFIEAVNPKKVFCVHGFDKEFAKTIREKLHIPASVIQERAQKLLTEF
jgi:Cft2 family RNA processing exonuclease